MCVIKYSIASQTVKGDLLCSLERSLKRSRSKGASVFYDKFSIYYGPSISWHYWSEVDKEASSAKSYRMYNGDILY